MQLADAACTPEFESALKRGVTALQRLAGYELEAGLKRRLADLGERKEFLGPDEHAELISLVEFSQRRTIEKLEAETALRQLRDLVPDLRGSD